MSVQGFSHAQIIHFYMLARPIMYTYAAAITLVFYDSVILFHREVEYIYRGGQSLIKWIYLLVKMSGIMMFLVDYFAYVNPPKTPTLCLVRQWVAGFFFEIIYTAVIKTLLVLRLRALYNNSRKVTIFLWSMTVLELLSTTYAYVMSGIEFSEYYVAPAPIPGCPMGPKNQLSHFRSAAVVWATRMSSNTVEVFLLLLALYRTLKDTDQYFHKDWRYMRQLAPVLYVFYRDGTIFYIPVCALSIFGFVATVANLTLQFTCSNWEAWLGIAYYITGTRLILNIRTTGVKFTTSMITREEISTLAFRRDDVPSESGEGSIETPESKSTVVLGIGGVNEGSTLA